MIAKALIGEAFDCGIEKNTDLRVSPIKKKSMQNMVNIKYDSIAGITKNTRVYMLYDNYKTYPEYINFNLFQVAYISELYILYLKCTAMNIKYLW